MTKSIKKKSKGAEENKALTAKQFIERLKAHQSDAELKKIQRYFKSGKGDYGEGDQFMGVKMGVLFSLAKEFAGMPVTEIEKLLSSPIHEIRAGAVSIMDKESRDKKTTPERRKEFFDLYIRRHDRINSWDLVDLGCLHMTGCHLMTDLTPFFIKWRGREIYGSGVLLFSVPVILSDKVIIPIHLRLQKYW